MSVGSDLGGIGTNGFEEESNSQGADGALGLLGSGNGTIGSTMQSTIGEGSGGLVGNVSCCLMMSWRAEGNREECPKRIQR